MGEEMHAPSWRAPHCFEPDRQMRYTVQRMRYTVSGRPYNAHDGAVKGSMVRRTREKGLLCGIRHSA